MAKINAQRHVSGKLQAKELGSQNNKAVDPNSAVTVTTSSTSYGTPWYPTSIASCSLWLDADDASSIVLNPDVNWAYTSYGTTAQSNSEYSSDYPANKAINGYTTSSNGYFISAQGTNEWLQIDFGQNRNIDRVVIWNRYDGSIHRLDGYRLDFYTGSYGSGSIIHTISESPGSSWESNTSTLTASINCRSIRLVNEDATQPQYLQVQEFQAFESSAGNTKVSEWQDKSGKGNHFSQTTSDLQPTYITSSSPFSPRSTVKTDPDNQTYLFTTSSTDLTTTVGSDDHITIFSVAKYNSNTNPGGSTWATQWTFGRGSLASGGGTSILFYSNDSRAGQYTNMALIGAVVDNLDSGIAPTSNIWTVRSNADGTIVRNSGSVAASTSNPIDSALNGTGLHALGDTAGTNRSSYDYAEFIVYNRGLTDDEITTVETYLQNKWGITVATQSSDLTSDNNQTAYPTQSFFSEVQDDCSLWADFTDTTKVKTTGSDPGNEVYRIEDKSRKNNVPVQNTSSQYPHYLSTEGFGLNNLPSLSGKTGHLDISSSWTANSASTVYGVFRKYENSGEDYLLSYGEKKIRTSGSNLQWVGTGDAILQASSSLSTYKDYIVTVSEEGQSFSPLSIPSCSLWLDADDASTITLNGSDVSQWQDKSGNNNHATMNTATSQPHYSASGGNGINGLGTIALRDDAGNEEYFDLPDDSVFQYRGNLTAFIVNRRVTGGTNLSFEGWIAMGNDTGDDWLWGPTPYPALNRASIWITAGGSNIKPLKGTEIGFGTSSIHSLAITGTTVSLFRGGSLDAQGTSAVDLDTSNSGLSSDRYLFQYSNRHAHEDVGEIITYNRCLSDDERATVETYLQNKWGITVATQSADAYPGTSSIYLNGVLEQHSSASRPSDSTVGAIAGSGSSDGNFAGNIGEIIMYDPAVTSWRNRKKVERYLADKYNINYTGFQPDQITASIDATGNSKSKLVLWLDANDTSTITEEEWSPLNIPSCSLWLDANDASTVILNGADVSQWQDKSGKGNHFGQATSSAQPEYITSGGSLAKPGIRASKTVQQYLSCSISTDLASTSGSYEHFTTFIVAKQVEAPTIITAFLYLGRQSLASDGGDYGWMQVANYPPATENVRVRFGQGQHISYQMTDFSDSARIMTVRSYVDGTDTRMTGTLANSDAASVTNIAGTGVHTIGHSYSNYCAPAEWGEIIHYNRGLTDAECATVETYLQNKWNITVATQSTDYYENKVSQWSNKSTEFPNLFDYKQNNASYQPLLATGAINSRSVVRFDGSDDFLFGSGSAALRSPAASDDALTFFIVIRNHPSLQTSYRSPFTWGMDSDYDAVNAQSFRPMFDKNGAGGTDLAFQSKQSTQGYIFSNVGITTTSSIYTFINDSSGQHYIDGTDQKKSAGNGLPIDTAYPNSDAYIYSRIGQDGDNHTGRDFGGDIAEIICYAKDLSSAERTKVETYLQNKWNITVATQSYVSTTVSGSVLTQWQDKSGNGLHLTASSAASAPVLSANEIYSYSAVQFSGTVSSSNPVLTSSAQYGTPFTPASVSGSSLVMWYDASDASSVTLNGTGTLQWRDKSGNNNHAGQSTAAAQPVYDTTNTLNGLSVMRFDNQAHFLSGTHGTMGNNENTVFLVAKMQDTGSLPSGTKALIGWGFSTTKGSAYSDGASLYYYNSAYDSPSFNSIAGGTGVIKPVYKDVGGSSNPGTYLNHRPDELFHSDRFSIHAWRYQQGNHKTNIFGREAEHTTGYNNSNNSTPGTKFRIGSYQHYLDYTLGFSGSIAEVIVYDSFLSDADRASVETYLQNKWNIATTVQSNAVLSGNYDPAYPTQSVSTEAKSIVSIIKQDNANSGSVWAFVSGSEYDGTLTTNEGGNTDFAYGGTTETSSFTSPFSNSTSSVVTAIWGGGYSKLYKDGTLLTSSQNNTTLSSSAYLALGTSFITAKIPWYPTNIPSCSLWLDADDASSITLNGSTVSQWNNKANHLTTGLFNYVQSNSSYQPTYVTGALNSRALVRFDGSNDGMFGSGSTSVRSFVSSGETDVTIFYVFSGSGGTQNNTTVLNWGLESDGTGLNGQTTFAFFYYDNRFQFEDWPGTGGIQSSTDVLAAGKQMISVVQEGAGSKLFVEGAEDTSAATKTDNPDVYPSNQDYHYSRLGFGRGTTGRYFSGGIAEIVIYDRALSDNERATVETYLQNKWNITVATQSSDIDTDNKVTGSIHTYWSGSIGEMLVYNKAISDKERRRAENYLKQKWRVTGSN